MSEGDRRFLRSLYEEIEQEKRLLQGPGEGPDQQRLTIYTSVFNKVIGRAIAYRSLLSTIKTEYDGVIRAGRGKEGEARAARRRLAAVDSQPASLASCLTLEESGHPEVLSRHLVCLEGERDALLARRHHYVSLEVKAELDTKMKTTEDQRDQLTAENHRLYLLYQALRFVSDSLVRWEESGQQVPVEDFLRSTLEDLSQTSESDHGADGDVFEDDEPTKVNRSQLLTDYLKRFVEAFEAGQFEDAALLAARSPHGVLRNTKTMEMFKEVSEYQGKTPPLLQLFQALLMSSPDGVPLPPAVSLEGVRCALEHGSVALVSHAVTQHKLTFTEALGDILTEHAQKDGGVTDACLVWATVVYQACSLHRKIALSMCRRGLIHGAAEFINHCQNFTTEDCIWVLCRCPSLSLLQRLTERHQGRAAILSVGEACSTLLLIPEQQELVLQLLDHLVTEGRLETAILQDAVCPAEGWAELASLCARLNQTRLSQEILSVLLAQTGTSVLFPDPEGARLMEHVFL
ncbi:clathrin heavy chain linker domain-containing protein 1-like [Diretmus argenteus]